MTASLLKSDLERAGFRLRAEAGRLLVSPTARLTPEWRRRIAAGRDGLLALLSPAEPWDQAAADGIVAVLKTRLTAHGLPEGEGERKLYGALSESVDRAYLARDFARLNDAGGKLLAMMEQLWPRQVGGRTEYGPAPELGAWDGCVRVKSRKWVVILRGVSDRAALEEHLHDYKRANGNVGVKVIPSGEDPNRKV